MGYDSPGLCEALRGLNISSLRLHYMVTFLGWYPKSLSLSSLTQLETLIIEVYDFDFNFLEALHGLCIKNLSLYSQGKKFINSESWLASIQSLSQLDTLSIDVQAINPSLWKAIYSLNIRRLILCGRGLLSGLVVNNGPSLVQAITSKQMETFYVDVNADHNLLKALYGLGIKSLSLCDPGDRMKVKPFPELFKSLSLFKTLKSLKQLEKLSVIVKSDSIGIWVSLRGLNIKSLSLCGWCGDLTVKYVSFLTQSLSSLTKLETLSIKASEHNPGLWKALHGLNIKCLGLDGWRGGFEVEHVDSISQSLSALTKLETLSIKVDIDSPSLWKAFHGLKIKGLSLEGSKEGLRVTHLEQMSQSLSSLTQLEMISIGLSSDSHGLWKAYRGLNIKKLSWWTMHWKVKDGLLMAESLTQLEKLFICVDKDSPGLWENISGLNIKGLTLRSHSEGLFVKHVSLLSQSISSFKYLDSLTVHLRTYIDIKILQTLKCLNFYCDALLPSELRELLYKLSASTHTFEGNLAFNCASFDGLSFKRIPQEDYIAFNHEMGSLKQVAVKRFRIYDRTNHFIKWIDSEDSAWSERANKVVVGDDHDDASVDDDGYTFYIKSISPEIINRISMRFQIIPVMVI
ncbi:hypothetical protein DPMN_184383 [Dreissena polymorpha]|uniref:Uncharacterized protein n=2 Tax=Dreissena polymorpha TaxID=45954 RepID=A0A9D4DJ48_DREPO|nr:hypothetical protein DPMN_184383 [Dreissena polymorpha]